MKTFEGTMKIKWYKNDGGGDCRPLTIDIDPEDRETLKMKLSPIKERFLNLGVETMETLRNGGDLKEIPFSVSFNMAQRK